jgi:hypothetical protein
LLGALSTALPTAAFSIASARLPTVLTTSFGLSTPLFTALFAGGGKRQVACQTGGIRAVLPKVLSRRLPEIDRSVAWLMTLAPPSRGT